MAVAWMEQAGVALFVVSMMVTVGLDLTWRDVLDAWRRPRAIGLAMLANYLVLPAVAWAVVRAVGLPLPVAAGVLLISAAPGGPVGAVLVRSAGGNLPLATSLVVVTNLLNTLLTPAIAGWFGVAPEAGGEVPVGGMIRTILLAQVLPLSLAVTLRTRNPALGARLSPHARRLANVVFALVTVAFVAANGRRLLAVPARALLAVEPVVLASLAVGWLVAPRRRADRDAMALVAGIRSMSVVLLVIAAWYPSPETLLTALSYSVSMFLWSALAARIMGRRAGAISARPAGAPGSAGGSPSSAARSRR